MIRPRPDEDGALDAAPQASRAAKVRRQNPPMTLRRYLEAFGADEAIEPVSIDGETEVPADLADVSSQAPPTVT